MNYDAFNENVRVLNQNISLHLNPFDQRSVSKLMVKRQGYLDSTFCDSRKLSIFEKIEN